MYVVGLFLFHSERISDHSAVFHALLKGSALQTIKVNLLNLHKLNKQWIIEVFLHTFPRNVH